MNSINRIQDILKDVDYQLQIEKITRLETDRIYCKHDMHHFLEVARIAVRRNQEQQLGFNQEILYAVALLHDIGRWVEYEDGTDHAAASARLAEPILMRCGFLESEIHLIQKAIQNHRNCNATAKLDRLFYQADKSSRPCISCQAASSCKRTPTIQ